MQFRILGTIHEQLFNPYKLLKKKEVKKENNVLNNDNLPNDNSTLSSFSLIDDTTKIVITGKYNPGNFTIVSPYELSGMVYGELGMTKFVIDRINGLVYKQNFNNYYLIFEAVPSDSYNIADSYASGYFITTSEYSDKIDFIEWAYVVREDNGTIFNRCDILKTVIFDQGIHSISKVYTPFENKYAFEYCPNLNLVCLSDNAYIRAIFDTTNIEQVNILINDPNNVNQVNIDSIKYAFSKSNPNFTLYLDVY